MSIFFSCTYPEDYWLHQYLQCFIHVSFLEFQVLYYGRWSVLNWVLTRERHNGFRTIYWRGCLSSNVFLAPLLRGCSYKALLNSGFHTAFYWPMYLVLHFCYYGSCSSLKSGIVVLWLCFCFLLFYIVFPFWDYFSSLGKKILMLWWRLNWICEFNNTK